MLCTLRMRGPCLREELPGAVRSRSLLQLHTPTLSRASALSLRSRSYMHVCRRRKARKRGSWDSRLMQAGRAARTSCLEAPLTIMP